jgi:hypothetical protein
MDAPKVELVVPGGAQSAMPPATRARRNWKPVLTLLLLSPAVGELLSGSSPPSQFVNPILLLFLLGLYGCGALLVRELTTRFHLNVLGILLLGVAYGIIEEGLTCKSFFNPYWKDVGYLSTYGRAWGVNWLWTLGLIAYHAVVSITVPVFLTEALFRDWAAGPWLRRRGWIIAGVCLGLVTLLGFVAFDSPEFHRLDLKDQAALVHRLQNPQDAVSQFVARQLSPQTRDLLAKGSGNLTPQASSALLNDLNRLLPRPDLYAPERFAGVPLPENVQGMPTPPPHGDKLVQLNRALLEAAYPQALAKRPMYPYRAPWPLTLGSLLAIAAVIALALRQRDRMLRRIPMRHAWRCGLAFTIGFAAIGFIVPGLVENGLRLPAAFTAGLWLVFAALVARVLRRLDVEPGRTWRRGLWALGVLTPWCFFALLLGLVVRFQGAKSFAGMPVVSLAAAAAIVILAIKWRRRLALESVGEQESNARC